MENIQDFINVDNLLKSFRTFHDEKPFPHAVIDNFFNKNVAQQLENEVPDFNGNAWHKYNNAIEVKKVCNDWNLFPPLTYRAFSILNSQEMLEILANKAKVKPLFSDEGLNGGGWHIHGKGGKLNTHLDYSIHPKLGLQRKLNIIIYLNQNWQEEWGGSLGLWDHDSLTRGPGELKKKITPKFNRAVIFDTTCNSWHGLPDPLTCPEGEYRKSLATYYLTTPHENASKRGKALFAPTPEQANDEEILELIKKRASISEASKVYKK